MIKRLGPVAGILFAVLSAVCFGLAGVLGKISYSGGNTAVSLAFYRAVMAVVVLFIIIKFVIKTPLHITSKNVGKILLLGTFGQMLTTVLLNMSYAYIPAGTASTLHFLYPAIVFLASAFLFGEKPTIKKTIVLILSFSGILFFFEGIDKQGILGLVLAVASGVAWAFYIIYMGHGGLSEIPALVMTFYMCIILAVECFLVSIFSGETSFQLSTEGWINTVQSGAFFCIALITLQLGIRYSGASTASIMGVFEPITGILAGVLLLKETLTVKKLIGAVVTLGAITILVWGERAQYKTKEKDNGKLDFSVLPGDAES